MSGAFQLVGGAADTIRQKLSSTAATVVAGSANFQTAVVWFECNEISGSTPSLTIEIYNATTGVSYYLGVGGVTYKAKALTALQSVFFEGGIFLNTNEFLRITANAANQVDVVGLALLGNSLS